MAKQLVVLAGPDEGRSFSLGTDDIMIGRSRATETQLTDPHVSHIHCELVVEGNKHILIDHDSGSGSFVNGKEIQRQPLQHGDLIRIGSTHLQFIDDLTPAPATPAMPASPPTQSVPKTTVDWSKSLVKQTLVHYHISAPSAKFDQNS